MTTVLFACVHNAGRSQIAAALFNRLADPSRARAISAGTQPAPHVHPEVIDVMKEDGIDLSGTTTTLLTPDLASGVQMLITMGCGEACPYIPGLQRDDWPLDDPKGRSAADVRAIRDDIRRRVENLISEAGWR